MSRENLIAHKHNVGEELILLGHTDEVVDTSPLLTRTEGDHGRYYIPRDISGDVYLQADYKSVYIFPDTEEDICIVSTIGGVTIKYDTSDVTDTSGAIKKVDSVYRLPDTAKIMEIVQEFKGQYKNPKLVLYSSPSAAKLRASAFEVFYNSEILQDSFSPEDVYNLHAALLGEVATLNEATLGELLVKFTGKELATPKESQQESNPPNNSGDTVVDEVSPPNNANTNSSITEEEVQRRIDNAVGVYKLKLQEKEKELETMRKLSEATKQALLLANISQDSIDKMELDPSTLNFLITATAQMPVQQNALLQAQKELAGAGGTFEPQQNTPAIPPQQNTPVKPGAIATDDAMSMIASAFDKIEETADGVGKRAEVQAERTEVMLSNLNKVSVNYTDEVLAFQDIFEKYAHAGHFVVEKLSGLTVGVKKVVKKDADKKNILIPEFSRDEFEKQEETYKSLSAEDKKDFSFIGNDGKKYKRNQVWATESFIQFSEGKPSKVKAVVVQLPANIAGLDTTRPETFTKWMADHAKSDKAIATVTKPIAVSALVSVLKSVTTTSEIKEMQTLLNSDAKAHKGVQHMNKHYKIITEKKAVPDYSKMKAEKTRKAAEKRFRPLVVTIQHDVRKSSIIHSNNFIPLSKPKTKAIAELKKKEDFALLNLGVFGRFTGVITTAASKAGTHGFTKLVAADKAKITVVDKLITSDFFKEANPIKAEYKSAFLNDEEGKAKMLPLTEVPVFEAGTTNPKLVMETLGKEYKLSSLYAKTVEPSLIKEGTAITHKTASIATLYPTVTEADLRAAVDVQKELDKKAAETAKGIIEGAHANLILNAATQSAEFAKNLNMPIMTASELKSLGL